MGLKINIYDLCVANMKVYGKQCKLVWYVDDNNISHMESKVVDKVIMEIDKKFGKMTINRGKEHVFVGMHVKFIDKGIVIILMKDYITESIEVFKYLGNKIITNTNTPDKRIYSTKIITRIWKH